MGMLDYQIMKEMLHKKVREKLQFLTELTDLEVMDIIDEVVLEEQLLRTLPVQYSQKISTELFYSIRRLDVIQALGHSSGVSGVKK